MSLWRRFRRSFIPHIVIAWDGWTPVGYGYGWCLRASSGQVWKWCFHIERVYIRPKYRGFTRKYMRNMLAAVFRWVDDLQLTGGAITRIKQDRLSVVKVGMRWGGYRPYTIQGGFIWCYVDRTAVFGRPVAASQPTGDRARRVQPPGPPERREGLQPEAGPTSPAAPASAASGS